MRTLNLSIDTFSVALGDRASSQFDENGYERITESSGNVEYSLYGTALESGSLYEPKLVWTVALFADRDTWNKLQAIYQRAERKRRSQQSYQITVDDYVQSYVEDATVRTRAIAPNVTVTNYGNLIEYPARFGVRMFEPKAVATRSIRFPYRVQFVLRELDQIAP